MERTPEGVTGPPVHVPRPRVRYVVVRLATDDAGAAEQAAAAEAWLAPAERAHAAHLRRTDAATPRRRALAYAVSRATCRLLLAAELGVAPGAVGLTRNAAGAPRSSPPHEGAAVSLSHSPRHVACAASADAGLGLGIDVEEGCRFVDAGGQALRLARRFLAPGTAQALASLAPPAQAQAFLRAWTVVEAVGKAHGTGLILPLRHAEVATAELTAPRAPRWLRVRGALAATTHVAALSWPAPLRAQAPIVSLACVVPAGKRPRLVAHVRLPFA